MSATSNIRYFDNSGREIPYDSLTEAAKSIVDSSLQLVEKEYYDHRSQPQGSYWPAATVMLSVAFFGFILVRKAWKDKSTTILPGSRDQRSAAYESLYKRQQLLKEYLLYEGANISIPEEQYHQLLSKRSHYYRKLAPELKEKFIERTKRFLSSKTFLLKTDEPFIDMPVLISATAVQLTFGLDDYLLPHYQYIRVYPEEYFANGTIKVLAGHVYGNTITLSWNHFLEGHDDYTDGVNLGLHEMAHALYYQCVHADVIRPKRFISNFNEVMAEGSELYQLRQSNPSQMFSENAYRNLQEFWAESVELFFERPAELQRENGELFQALVEMLNQNPISGLYPVLT